MSVTWWLERTNFPLVVLRMDGGVDWTQRLGWKLLIKKFVYVINTHSQQHTGETKFPRTCIFINWKYRNTKLREKTGYVHVCWNVLTALRKNFISVQKALYRIHKSANLLCKRLFWCTFPWAPTERKYSQRLIDDANGQTVSIYRLMTRPFTSVVTELSDKAHTGEDVDILWTHHGWYFAL